jgi:molybdopterin molybdotransferase
MLVRKGERLSVGNLALLSAVGIEKIKVSRRPAVAVIATGSELMEPGESVNPGRIYESNRTMLAPLLGQANAEVRLYPIVRDSLEETRTALEHAFSECDALVTSGGASVGEHDLVKKAIEMAGGQVQFWRVAIKPGKPFVLGQFGDKLLFGLPGNPVSAFVTFLLLVRPALLKWQGATEVDLPAHPGRLGEPLRNEGSRRHFMRVQVDHKGVVRSAGVQASHVLSSLSAANGLVEVPPDTFLPEGEMVKVLRWTTT